jgi:CRISPR-associated protein Csc1
MSELNFYQWSLKGETTFISYDVVNMPPVSLIQNVQMRGKYYYFDNIQVKLPVQMQYCFRK